jgi:hypothetical protein
MSPALSGEPSFVVIEGTKQALNQAAGLRFILILKSGASETHKA